MKVLLDANLVTLLVLGSTDRRLIGENRRISGYSQRDFDDLTDELGRSEAIVILPNVMTEVSNLVGSAVHGPLKRTAFVKLKRLIDAAEEHYVRSSVAAGRSEFARLGLTDAALLFLGGADCSLLTDDNELYVAALVAGRQARNFRHIRAER